MKVLMEVLMDGMPAAAAAGAGFLLDCSPVL